MINLFKQLFIWWNRQTLGTSIYTLFTGKCVGKDEFGNNYYTNKKGKRWVVYNNEVEASKIPPEWHMWIHFLTNQKPKNNIKKYVWQIKHVENLSGTNNAYKPDGSLISKSKKNIKKYETWQY
tara:strand:+ start:116 stop:484 length:369 start_codon:yes stop_codon:yes gene_type:complete